MIAKCQCQQCGQSVEFDAAQFERSGETSHRLLGQTIDCPNCGVRTQLYLPRVNQPAFKMPAATPARGGLVKCPDCGNDVSRKALYCPSCGAFERDLFRNIWRIVSTFWLVSLVFAVLGLILWKLFTLAAG